MVVDLEVVGDHRGGEGAVRPLVGDMGLMEEDVVGQGRGLEPGVAALVVQLPVQGVVVHSGGAER